MRRVLDVTSIKYPTLSFSKGVVIVQRTAEDLTTCGKGALKNGWFDDLLIVDSAGLGYRVASARKLHGVGPFWGYNIFFNRRIKAEILVSGEAQPVPLEDVRRHVLRSFQQWHGWSTEEGFEELRDRVEAATSIPQIISLIAENQERH